MMSDGLSEVNDCSLKDDDDDELFEIRERCKEVTLIEIEIGLTREKEMLRDTKSESFELIRKMEFHLKALSESREEDKKRIADLERELNNSIQEIDYLQDQLNMRSSDQNFPSEQMCSYQFADTENISESERSLLMREIEDKEVEIRYSASHVEKLEESISSMALEYQCEIETMKLELFSLEKILFETKKLLEETTLENTGMNELIRDLQLRNQDANTVIERLEKENKDLKEELQRSDMHIKSFLTKLEEQFHEWLGNNDSQSLSKLESSTFGNFLGPLFTKHAIPMASSDVDLRNKMAEMSRQIDDYECLVMQLKEEVKDEKLKAKEEAEDLAQEMAELRYHLTDMLDKECKRRASIEQISLQRITELEAQITKERQKSISPQDLVVRNQ
ncbi:hypothetical protein ACP275_09G053200 [Erythranthe tilingii]